MATESNSNLDLNESKTASRPSHEAVESQNSGEGEHGNHTHLNQEAMKMAKRGQNQIHADEETTPDSTIFSK